MMKALKNLSLLLLTVIIFGCSSNDVEEQEMGKVWSEKKANDWYSQFGFMAGTNFNPSSAINQLEMWQTETFDTATIRRELKWSADLGFNLHRVYLHNLVYEQDGEAFLDRMDQFLTIADEFDIKIMPVLLDDVWDPNPKLGTQRAPVKGLHNSGWVQSPGREYLSDSTKFPLIKEYVQAVLTRFKDDQRVLLWDLYNEPDNNNWGSYGEGSEAKTELSAKDKERFAYRLLKKTFEWARAVNPSQPLSMGIWRGNIDHWGNLDSLPRTDKYMIENSDVITFHAYDHPENVIRKIEELKKYNRPMLCTEYIARGNNNTFEAIMPLFKKDKIAAINWGFVSGKTNTIYPWHSWDKPFEQEPEVWHHDILRADGTPYSETEVTLIKKMMKE
jgi:hypothetical protein